MGISFKYERYPELSLGWNEINTSKVYIPVYTSGSAKRTYDLRMHQVICTLAMIKRLEVERLPRVVGDSVDDAGGGNDVQAVRCAAEVTSRRIDRGSAVVVVAQVDVAVVGREDGLATVYVLSQLRVPL